MYDPSARKRTVSLTLNADLYVQARKAGINLSQVAEEAIAQALAQRLAKQAAAEIREDLDAYNKFVAEHGSFAEMAREYYAAQDADAAV